MARQGRSPTPPSDRTFAAACRCTPWRPARRYRCTRCLDRRTRTKRFPANCRLCCIPRPSSPCIASPPANMNRCIPFRCRRWGTTSASPKHQTHYSSKPYCFRILLLPACRLRHKPRLGKRRDTTPRIAKNLDHRRPRARPKYIAFHPAHTLRGKRRLCTETCMSWRSSRCHRGCRKKEACPRI